MSKSNTLSGLLAANHNLAKLAKQHTGLAEIAALLIELRQQLGLSQKEFARRAGVPKTMVSELENAANEGITLRTLAKIAKGGSLKLNLSFELAATKAEIGLVESTLNLSSPYSYKLTNTPAMALLPVITAAQEDGLAA